MTFQSGGVGSEDLRLFKDGQGGLSEGLSDFLRQYVLLLDVDLDKVAHVLLVLPLQPFHVLFVRFGAHSGKRVDDLLLVEREDE